MYMSLHQLSKDPQQAPKVPRPQRPPWSRPIRGYWFPITVCRLRKAPFFFQGYEGLFILKFFEYVCFRNLLGFWKIENPPGLGAVKHNGWATIIVPKGGAGYLGTIRPLEAS